MNLIKIYPILFLISVVLPILGGAVTAYLGWDNLKNKYEDDEYRKEARQSSQAILHNQKDIKKSISKEDDKNTLKPFFDKKILSISTYFTISKMASSLDLSYTKNGEVKREKLKKILKQIKSQDPSGDNILLGGGKYRASTWLEAMSAERVSTKNDIKELLGFSEYLDKKVIIILKEIDESVLSQVLDMNISGVLPFRNKYILDLESEIFEYLNLQKKLLKAYKESIKK